MEQKKHLFSNRDLWKLLVPIIIEQFLTCLMGTVDTMMVSNVGSAAISAVSLVDSINVLLIQAFSALAAGGTIICSHYLGSRNEKMANHAAKQLLFIITVISSAIAVLCVFFCKSILSLIFGSIEQDVMNASVIYFYITACSFPFIAIYDAGASIFRAQEDTRCPMMISVASNVFNIAGNALLIYGFRLGVMGAGLATLASRIFCAVVVMFFLRKPTHTITVKEYFKIRPDWSVIKRILAIGIPSGVENSMFQVGKLAIQSTVSTLGTISIAAQAMTNMLESLSGMGGIGVGIGLMTIVGECLGAGRKEEAVYYIRKLTILGEIIVAISCIVVYLLAFPVTIAGRMEAESARMCLYMMGWITVIKPIIWTLAFIPAYGLRAAGDVKFSMILSSLSMWLCRVTLCIYLIRVCHFGPIAVWIGMFADWSIRAVCFTWRFCRKKWLGKRVI